MLTNSANIFFFVLSPFGLALTRPPKTFLNTPLKVSHLALPEILKQEFGSLAHKKLCSQVSPLLGFCFSIGRCAEERPGSVDTCIVLTKVRTTTIRDNTLATCRCK